MSKARPTAYQKFYWGDFFAKTAHLHWTERAAYAILIGRYWAAEKPLADNDEVMARLLGSTEQAWLSVRPALEEFFVIANGEWRHERIEHDLVEAHENYAKSIAHAKAGADKRWGKNKVEPQHVDAPTNARALPEQCQPKPKPKPEPEPTKKEKTLTPAALALDGFDDFWAAYSRHDSRRSAEKAFPGALKKVGGDLSIIVRAAKSYSRQFVTGVKDKQYQAMAASWLNGERWADQPLTTPVMDSEAAEEARKLREAEYLRISLEESKNNKPLFAPWMKD